MPVPVFSLSVVTVSLGSQRVEVDLAREVLCGNKRASRRLVRAGRPCKYQVGRSYPLVRTERPGATLGLIRVTAVWDEPLSDVEASPESVSDEGLPRGATPQTLVRLLQDIYELPWDADPAVWVVCLCIIPGTSRLRPGRLPERA